MTEQTIARRLARWVVGLRYEDLPRDVITSAQRCLLDTLGVQVFGATLPWVQPVYRHLTSDGGTQQATVTYHGDRLSATNAAYINSTFSAACELQHHGSLDSGHTGVVVVPLLQAVGEALGSTGRDIVTAMVAGYEVQGRLGAELSSLGAFHRLGVLGVFGAAAAAGKLLELDEEQLAHAFAIAGSHASTISEYEQTGGEVKRIHGAIALRNGLQSVLFAKEGLTGPATVFEGHKGLFAAFDRNKADPERVVADLGPPYCITRCRFRIYPTNGHLHPVLDMLNELTMENKIDYRAIEHIEVGMASKGPVPSATTVTRPSDVVSAQYSLGFSVAVRLVMGSNDLEMYTDPHLWRDHELLNVVDKVRAYPLPPAEHPRATRIEIRLRSGQVLQREQDDARGSPSLPFSQDEIEAKFRRLARSVLSSTRVEQIIHTAGHLEDLPSVSTLPPLLIGREAGNLAI